MAFPQGIVFNLYGTEVRGGIDGRGYREVILNNKHMLLHRVIAKTFLPNIENKKCVNHKDGNKLNNNVSNLEWCTHSENTIHAYRNGLEKKVYGEKHHSHKLTEENVRYIRENYIKGNRKFGASALGRIFNVDKSTVEAIVKRETWKEVI